MSDLWSRRLGTLPWAPRARYPHLATGDEVALDVRRHPITLAAPALRTLSGVLLLVMGRPNFFVVALFALSVAVWARSRIHANVRRSLVVVAVPLALLLIAPPGAARAILLAALVLWLAEDLADWFTDRLVVTRKRVYRLYGVFTTHSPSIALTSVTYIDPLQPLLGRVFGFGTILLDSAAQRDEPLSRFDHLPEADYVHFKILELRAAAIPKFPHLPGTPV